MISTVIKTRCSSCQDEEATTRFAGDPVCLKCGFWLHKRERSLATSYIYFHTEDWIFFNIGAPGAPIEDRGYGGKEFLVIYPGRPYAPCYTRNLWNTGIIPVHLRANWPDDGAKLKEV